MTLYRSAKVSGSADRSTIITGNVPIDTNTENENLACPYRGLFHFSPDDAEFFFGRQVFVEELFAAI